MNKLTIGALLAAAFLLAALPALAAAERKAEWATPVGKAPNLFRVSPTLYRSAQLGAKDAAELQELGIKNVIGLRAFHSDERWLRKTGIKTSRVKIYTWAISDTNVINALRAIRTAEKEGPVLLHCWHGADRTGLVSAMYRILYQGWTKEQALDEMLNGGYGYHSLWKNIPVYLKTVDVEKVRLAVEAP